MFRRAGIVICLACCADTIEGRMQELSYNLLLISAQIVTAGLLSLVFLGYYRLYRRPYLGWWSISFLLLGVYSLLSTAAALAWTELGYAASHPARLALTAGSLTASYSQVLFLLLGVAGFGRDRAFNLRRLGWFVALLCALALLVTFVYVNDPSAGVERNFWRVQLRFLLTGSAFTVAAVALLLGRSGKRWRLGRLLLAMGFLAYALYAGLLLAASWSGGRMPGAILILNARGLFELVVYFAIGMGMVMWLLERERERSTEAQRRADYLDRHDALTGLPNRQSLLVFLEQRRWSEPQPFVLYLVGIDRFRMLNESLGLQGGDQFLRDCADRLRARKGHDLTLARIAGDIFAVVIPHRRDEDVQQLDTEAKALATTLAMRPGGGFSVPMTASVGYTVSNDGRAEPLELLSQAQAALAAAKDTGPESLVEWRAGMKSNRDRQMKQELAMRRLLSSDQLALYFQPIVDLQSGQIVSAEALIRWLHPKKGVLSPLEFLPAMQEAGLMEALDERVLTLAFEHQAQSQRQGQPTVPLSINLTASQFQREGLSETLRQSLRAHGLEPSCAQLEVTETNAMVDIPMASRIIEQVRSLGIVVSIDDFGTGYSSLAYLSELPVDRIKIDRRFVQTIGESNSDSRFVQGIVSMIHTIGAKAVAEGVETAEQEATLRGYGCDYGQGYLFSRPLSATRLIQRLEEQTTGVV